jgi:hypothetical protein
LALAIRAVLEECLMLARAVGDTFHAGMATHVLGLVALEADRDLEAAWSLNADSLAALPTDRESATNRHRATSDGPGGQGSG